MLHLQTVFEGSEVNTPDRGPREAEKHGVQAPVGYDAHVDGIPWSTFMVCYGTRGTPWTTVIDRGGLVRFNDFTPAKATHLVKLVDRLLAEDGSRESTQGEGQAP